MATTEILFRDAPYERGCDATVVSADDTGIRLDRTVFYATSGGQPGDTGRLILSDGTAIPITGTIKGETLDDIIHVPADGIDLPVPGTPVTAEIDWERRYRHMRMHTCLHLLTAVIAAPITGAQLGDEKGRIDFNLPEMNQDKATIQQRLDALIAADTPVEMRWITDDELAARPELVKTMSIRPPAGAGHVRLIDIDGVDLQPCGGTHVARTGEVGAVTVRKIESKGKQNRRVAITLNDT